MKRHGRAPEPIGSLLDALLAEHGYLAICKEQDILLRWKELAGERIAAVTECTTVERGVVHVRVQSAPWRNELVYLKPMLLARLRAQCEGIKDIVYC
jgi:predicted nucleic acid-binding Zn ribbon protein